MGIKRDGSGQIVHQTQHKRTLAAELLALKPSIAAALPRHLDPERMARICMTALRTTPKLNECTLPSFLGSVLQLAQLGLEPMTPLGEAYLIPRKIKGTMTCTIIIGYQGLLDIAYRSGKVGLVYAHVVRAGDVWDYDYGLNRKLVHKPQSDDAELIACYAVAELTSGHKAFAVLTAGQVHKRKMLSQAGKSGPWHTHEEAMWQKTALRELYKYLPKSPELVQAQVAAAIDEAPEYGEQQQRLFTTETQTELESRGIDPLGDEAPDPEPPDDAVELEGEVMA